MLMGYSIFNDSLCEKFTVNLLQGSVDFKCISPVGFSV